MTRARVITLVVVLFLMGLSSFAWEAVASPVGSIEFVQSWGDFGQGPGQFHQPRGIAIDSEGDVFVVDAQNVRVQVFTPNGIPVDAWGMFPPGPAEFDRPTGIAADSRGRIAVAQSINGAVNVFTREGVFLFVMKQLGSPPSVEIDQDGYFYVGEGDGRNQIRRLSPDGISLSRFGQGLFGYDSPGGIAVTAGGEVIASDTGNDRILVFSTEGTLLRQWGFSGVGPGQFDEPRGVAVDPSGNVYVADTSNQRMQVFDATGRFLIQWGCFGLDPGEFRYPWDVAVDGSGSVYVTDCFNHRVQKFHVTLPTSAGMLTAVQPTTWGRLKTMFARQAKRVS